MKLRHKTEKEIVVDAWQYDKAAPVPIWVCRVFHDLGDGVLSSTKLPPVKPGEWVARFPTVGGWAYASMTNEDRLAHWDEVEEKK